MPLLIRCSFRTLVVSFPKDNLFSASILLKSVKCLCDSSSAAILIKNRVHEVFRSRMTVPCCDKDRICTTELTKEYKEFDASMSIWSLGSFVFKHYFML